MESYRAVLGSDSESHGNYVKIEHENGLNFRPPFKRKILMKFIREFSHKFIEAYHFKIGIQ